MRSFAIVLAGLALDGSFKRVFKGTKTVTRKLPETPAETAQRLGDSQEHRAAALNKTQAKVG